MINKVRLKYSNKRLLLPTTYGTTKKSRFFDDFLQAIRFAFSFDDNCPIIPAARRHMFIHFSFVQRDLQLPWLRKVFPTTAIILGNLQVALELLGVGERKKTILQFVIIKRVAMEVI